MNRLKIWFILMFFSSVMFAQTDSTLTEDDEDEENAEWLKGNMNETHKYGIKIGFSLSTMLGNELQNPAIKMGLLGAGYYRYKYNQKGAVQAEFGISLRGSNFNNSNGEYSRINTTYIDVPCFWVRSINKKNNWHVLLGAQYAWLINSAIYVEPNNYAETEKPKLLNYDVMVVGGAQAYAGFVGFQLMIKYGLIDINNGLISNLNPPLKNQNINNFAIELALLF